ncbi:MAG: transcription antitermination factor NusB [Paludibacteraceae bacterium]|nr:transcription antitermination factor NusB [Paludibacteraceae bacterium]
MINRVMVRTRVIQTLFAYYKDGDKTLHTVHKELRKSFADTYDLYFVLLDFANELTAYAQKQLEEQRGRARATHSDWTANKRFVNNRLAQQLFDNRALRTRMQEQHLAWDSGMTAVMEIYRQLVDSDFFRKYMESPVDNYEEDKKLWRQIYQYLLTDSETLLDALDEMEVVLDKANWTTDADVIVSYVIKTIKRFKEDSTPDMPLLEMFDSNEEEQFAIDLLDKAIEGHEQYERLINAHLKGWDADRIADMDRVLVEAALAEILNFEDIPLTISLNEYIELAKTYSGDKSYMFVNGILTEILREMKEDGTIFKTLALK